MCTLSEFGLFHSKQDKETMRAKLSRFQRLFVLILLVSSSVTVFLYFNRLKPTVRYIEIGDHRLLVESDAPIKQEDIDKNRFCFRWDEVNHRNIRVDYCLNHKQIQTIIWTHYSSGLMKFIQWIRTRKLAHIRIVELDDFCRIDKQYQYQITNQSFIQIYVLSFLSKFDNTSRCSRDIIPIIEYSSSTTKHIYFKRQSVNATIAYQHLDTNKDTHNLTFNWNSVVQPNLQPAKESMESLTNKFKDAKVKTYNLEEMIHSDLTECENMLKDFLQFLQIDIKNPLIKKILEYDAPNFVSDAYWWDQSETIETLISSKLPSHSENFSYSNDFYHFHGNYTFARYLYDNRQCYRDGIFAQMQHETKNTNRTSTDQPERCSAKQFDCAFSDIYSLSDRDQLYQKYDPNQEQFSTKTIKCGFAIPSVIDKVRERYGRNQSCQTIVLTSISNCYDPLPTVQAATPNDICYIALLDTQTYKVFQAAYSQGNHQGHRWDLIDLGHSGQLFRVPSKITETLKIVGHRMFPMAKWIVWLDGKAYIINIKQILTLASTPIVGLHHSDFNRTSESEVNLTNDRVTTGEMERASFYNMTAEQARNSTRLKTSLLEIALQEEQYKREGFYSRSNKIGLPLYDIAIYIFRLNQPCISRYLCGWHNEVNYFSYRGQLSVYYAAERLNLYTYLGFIPRKFYHTMAHFHSC